MRENRGITLITLAVTIIVLLILAGVSISMLVGDNGIITQAQKAKENMQIAFDEEQREIVNLEETLKESLEGIESEEKEIRLEDLKAGDYIEYDSGSNGKILCRVLYPANSENGLQIISDKNVKGITLGIKDNFEASREAYNNAIETLNNEAEVYINVNYATDARCVGSIPRLQEGIFIDKNKATDTTVKLPPTMPEGEDSSTWWSNYKRPSGWQTDDTQCYNTDTNYIEDETQMQLENINLLETGEFYWLASRVVPVYSSYCHFDVRGVNERRRSACCWNMSYNNEWQRFW